MDSAPPSSPPAGRGRKPGRRAPNAPNFKDINVDQLGGAPDLLPVDEGDEFEQGFVGEGDEKCRAVTYGRIVGFARQAIINDDLRAFNRLITAFAVSASRLENRANAALSVNVALFHSTRGSLSGTGALINMTTLGAGRAVMRAQKGLAAEEVNSPRRRRLP